MIGFILIVLFFGPILFMVYDAIWGKREATLKRRTVIDGVEQTDTIRVEYGVGVDNSDDAGHRRRIDTLRAAGFEHEETYVRNEIKRR